MAEVTLHIRISAYRRKDAQALADKISDKADGLFEDATIEHGRPMSLFSWVTVTPPTRAALKESAAGDGK